MRLLLLVELFESTSIWNGHDIGWSMRPGIRFYEWQPMEQQHHHLFDRPLGPACKKEGADPRCLERFSLMRITANPNILRQEQPALRCNEAKDLFIGRPAR